MDLTPLEDFVDSLSGGASAADWLWQLLLGVIAFALGRFFGHYACSHIESSRRWRFGKGDFERVAVPFFTVIFIALAKVSLRHFQGVVLLEIAQSLLVAWLVIRVAVYILGHIIPEGAFLRTVVGIVATVAWIAVVLHVTGLLPEVIAGLDDIGFTLGKTRQRITLWLVIQAVIALGITLTVALWIGRITETRLLAAESLQMSTRIVMSKLVQVGALLLAVLIALPMVGIDVTTLSVFSGALGVGLGFGLQKIASNYVSGFIVLLDRSIRLGDIVTIDNRKGEVRAIESRYTVIRGADGVESIIPNETLITTTVQHHTYTDPKVSMVVAVSISYDSDVDKACELLLRAARAQGRVIQEPAAAARVKSLGESGIDLELTVWIKDPSAGEAELRSALLKEIVRSFRANAIDIPYPRRDVRLIATPETGEKRPASST